MHLYLSIECCTKMYWKKGLWKKSMYIVPMYNKLKTRKIKVIRYSLIFMRPIYCFDHGLRTPNEGINQRYLKKMG